jgi:hypothetical protein
MSLRQEVGLDSIGLTLTKTSSPLLALEECLIRFFSPLLPGWHVHTGAETGCSSISRVY